MKKYLLSAIALMTALTLSALDEKYKTYTVGDMKITCIEDSTSSFPSEIFKEVKQTQIKKHRFPDNFAGSVNVFLVEENGRRVLIDAGNPPGKGKLHETLELMQIPMDSINAVLITHIHPDHVGGLVDSKGKPAFPKALIGIARDEYEGWLQKGNKALMSYLQPYGRNVRTFEYGMEVFNGITSKAAKGHTPGHAIFRKDNVVFVGDILHADALQFERPGFCAKFDQDKNKAYDARVELLKNAAAEKTRIFGAHIQFPGNGFVKNVTKLEDEPSFTFTPAEE